MNVLTQIAGPRVEAEREELNWLISSGALGRSNHLARMLTFICEKHFEGEDDHVKEYTIAVEALGRRTDFDPQTDTIVRVTAHSLRKRLQEIYQGDGADRPVHILIPAGHYLPSFVHRKANGNLAAPGSSAAANSAWLERASLSAGAQPLAGLPDRLAKPAARWMLPMALLLAVSVLAGAAFLAHRSAAKATEAPLEATSMAAPLPKDTIHALMGNSRAAYTDHSGNSWAPGNYCTGGDSIKLPDQKIVGTEDAPIYLGGIRGIAHCTFPVKPGEYEMHFYFAETSDLLAATRLAHIAVNAGPDTNFDVVDDAGGDNIATSYVMTGIRPENDGSIHLDFTSEISLLDAVEILPAPSDDLLPVRITASPSAITDAQHQVWLSDRYFSGGRRGQHPLWARTENRGIYNYDRIGRFRYAIPVVPQGRYRVTLFFSEPWFGQHNGGTGGVGSRVFNVSCNGMPLLKNFDIMAEGGANPVVKTFDNIQPTGQGKIELSFLPVVNYPLVNAVEVVPEPAP